MDEVNKPINPRDVLLRRFQHKKLEEITNLHGDHLSTVIATLQNSESGVVDKDTFSSAMVLGGHDVFADHEFIDALWNALDINHDHAIDVKELIIGFSVLSGDSMDRKLRLGFRVFDINQDGYIQRDELKVLLSAMSKMKYQNSEDLNAFIQLFVDQTFQQFDDNEDDQLSFEEFQKAALSNEEIMSFFTLSVANE
eukprot:TRINITY_DN11944_c0_g1_i1.p1 TRINITY_DN11944_c0_g1~~TRINITY_DN11944_c0_g1_i1.p1  ORF type:complete len:196 (-),score=42.49 TRINITY_DN11944_c0_g1_i1:35-622(-)